MLNATRNGGTELVYANFIETLNAIRPLMLLRVLGGVMYLFGFLLMGYNLWKTICDGSTITEFRFRESLRPETVGAFHALRKGSFAIDLLSGDRTEKVAQTASALSLPRAVWHAELTPAETLAAMWLI